MVPTKAFEALAHETRLAVFRLLVPVGRQGMAAGRIAEQLRIPPNALSFHLARLTAAELVTTHRKGRHLFYAIDYAVLADLVRFFAGECCADAPEGCLADCPSSVPPLWGTGLTTNREA